MTDDRSDWWVIIGSMLRLLHFSCQWTLHYFYIFTVVILVVNIHEQNKKKYYSCNTAFCGRLFPVPDSRLRATCFAIACDAKPVRVRKHSYSLNIVYKSRAITTANRNRLQWYLTKIVQVIVIKVVWSYLCKIYCGGLFVYSYHANWTVNHWCVSSPIIHGRHLFARASVAHSPAITVL